MADRYQTLYRLPANLYIEGSPVIIVAGALLKDTADNAVIGQLKILNISPNRIISCKVLVNAFSISGDALDTPAYFDYLDINVSQGESFGTKVPIPFQNSTTRKYTVSVSEVVFLDGSIWRAPEKEWSSLPTPKTADQYFSDRELLKQYKLELGENHQFIPLTNSNLFFCSCGAISLGADSACYKCRRTYQNISKILSDSYLNGRKEERLKQETISKQQREEAAKKQAEEKKRKQKKFAKMVIALAIATVTMFAVSRFFIIPEIQKAKAYKEATMLMSEGAYDEAAEAFLSLNNYKDSQSQVEHCQELKMEAEYQDALELLNNGNFKTAKNRFLSLSNYKDSAEMVDKCDELENEDNYQKALDLMNQGKYDQAMEMFSALGHFNDSEELVKKCQEAQNETAYQEALALIETGDYQEAVKILYDIRYYKDADDLIPYVKGMTAIRFKDPSYESLVESPTVIEDKTVYVNFASYLQAHPGLLSQNAIPEFNYDQKRRIYYSYESNAQDVAKQLGSEFDRAKGTYLDGKHSSQIGGSLARLAYKFTVNEKKYIVTVTEVSSVEESVNVKVEPAY